MNLIQSIRVSDTRLQKYLSENRLLLTYCILQYGVKTLMARREILDKKACDFRNVTLMEYSPTDSLTVQIPRRQVLHLDLLSTIFMFMEDFLGYSHNLRKPLHKFPRMIASRNDRTVSDEIVELKKYKKRDIGEYLLFPNVQTLPLDSKEKRVVSRHQRNISEDTFRSIRNILRFHKGYYRVYIKYKHIFNALLGFYSETVYPQKKQVKISSQIYIRDYNKGFSTYIIPTTDLGSVEYYQGIIDDIFSVFLKVMTAYLGRMVNLGNPFVFPMVPKEDPSASKKLEDIFAKVNYNSQPLLPVETQLSFSEKLSANIITKMRKEHIVKLRRDIFDYRQKQSNQK